MAWITASVLCIYLANQIIIAGSAGWTYDGDFGPKAWHSLFPTACSGKYQSPIDIRTRHTEYDPVLNDFAIWHDPPTRGSRYRVLNNGHAIQVNTFGPFYVANGGLPSVYSLAQFHFHWGHANHQGSEHLINGRASPIELHAVHWDSDNYGSIAEAMVQPMGLAVLGVMFKISERDNPILSPIIDALDLIQDPDTDTEVEIPVRRLRDFLPQDTSKYYRYNGSLTTPNCFESVLWTVFEEEQTISFNQLAKFRRVLQPKRHKHGRHHKRHLGRMRRGTSEVLDEVGIKGNIAEELELQAELKRQAQMKEAGQHDGHANIGEPPTKFQLNDQDVPYDTTVDEPKPTAGHDHHDHHHDHHTDHHPDEKPNHPDEKPTPEPQPEPDTHEMKHHGDGHGGHHDTNAGSEIVVEQEDIEMIQEYLVNNFRPVQKLNGRKIYRSFEFERLNYRTRVGATRSQTSDSNYENTGNKFTSSIVTTIISILIFMCL